MLSPYPPPSSSSSSWEGTERGLHWFPISTHSHHLGTYVYIHTCIQCGLLVWDCGLSKLWASAFSLLSVFVCLLSLCLLLQVGLGGSDVEEALLRYDRALLTFYGWEIRFIRRALLSGGALVTPSQWREKTMRREIDLSSVGEDEDSGEGGERLLPTEDSEVGDAPALTAGTGGSTAPGRSSDSSRDKVDEGERSVEENLGALKDTRWEEGAVLDGYPVAFYSPSLKVKL